MYPTPHTQSWFLCSFFAHSTFYRRFIDVLAVVPRSIPNFHSSPQLSQKPSFRLSQFHPLQWQHDRCSVSPAAQANVLITFGRDACTPVNTLVDFGAASSNGLVTLQPDLNAPAI